MKHSVMIRFLIAAMLISAGCALLLAGNERAGILFGLAVVFFMPRSELYQPIPRRELWIVLGVLIALVAPIVAVKYLLPSSVADVVHRVICNPAFVVPLWLFMLWGLFRHYWIQKGQADA